MRIVCAGSVALGLILANLVGFEGLWMEGTYSQSALAERYHREWREWEQMDPDNRPSWDDRTAVKQSRMHGWPSYFAYDDVLMMYHGPGSFVRSIPWPIDGTKRFEIRTWRFFFNFAIAMLAVFATDRVTVEWLERPPRFRMRPVAVLALASLPCLLFWGYFWRDRYLFLLGITFYDGTYNIDQWAYDVVPGGAWYDGLALVGSYYSRFTTLIGVCAIGIWVSRLIRPSLFASEEPVEQEDEFEEILSISAEDANE